MVVFLAQRYSVLSSDPLLAWPITDSIAHPEKYAPEDLLVTAGKTGNFFLYQLLAQLSILQHNYPLRDFLIYLPLLFLLLVAWWKVFVELGGTRWVATLSVMVVLFSDDKLALNWAHVVPPYFISSSSVQFAQVLGLLWFLRKRKVLALCVTAATGYLHPASAMSFGAVYAVLLCWDAYKYRDWRELVPILLFAAILLPAALLIASNSQGAFAVSDEYFKAFQRYQPQAYLGDHFRMGYAYTLAVIAFLYFYLKRTANVIRHRDELILFVGVGLALSAAWLINLYLTKNVQIIHTFFPMRLFTLIKPLLVYLILMSALSLYESATSMHDRAIVLLFAMTPLVFSPSVSLVIVVVYAAYAAGNRWWPALLVLLIAFFLAMLVGIHETSLRESLIYLRNFGKRRAGNEFNLFQLVVLLGFVFFVARVTWITRHVTAISLRWRHVLVAVLVGYVASHSLNSIHGKYRQGSIVWPTFLNFDPREYWGIRKNDSAYAELLDWVRGSSYKLYSIPPYNDRFLSFRYLTGKGVYIFHRDIAQLMYSPSYYVTGVNRLVELGGSAPHLPKAFMDGEITRDNGTYETQCRKLISAGKFDAVVLERRRLGNGDCPEGSAEFENDAYVVFRTTTHQVQRD